MPNITLPDGKKLSFSEKVTGTMIVEKISKSLAKEALIMSVNGDLKDLSFEIENDSEVKILTSKDNDGLDTIRHDTAHILAMAVQELFPGTQVTIGPTIENGFYYDFSRKEPFTESDLKEIEVKMSEIVDRNETTNREVWERDKAISHFKKMGENYKAEIIRDIPKNEEISIYFHGKWHDLCRGPHLPSTGKIGKNFKLTKVAGAYWRGDSKNEMLQRIYGTSWASKKDLEDYLKRLEEAEKRDHRKLGKEMDLFHFREESPGAVFWHEKGWNLFQKLVNYMRKKQQDAGYKEINTPEILDRSLWEKSGHWEKFGAHMYTSQTPDEKIFAVKPMNCPGCVQVFNQGLKSYRDLPLKMSEFGNSDEVWDKSEKALIKAVKETKLDYSINKGEGAFYGPKIEFVLRDAIGRDWQCGTLQVDLNLPERLGASYVEKDGSKKVPVMLHRALFGSLERFIGILIENYSGKLPFWISPLQTVVIPVSDEFDDYSKKVNKELIDAGFSSEVDLKNHNLNYKIRDHSLSKVPILLICGKKEVDSNSVTIRRLDSKKQENIELKKFITTHQALNKAPSL